MKKHLIHKTVILISFLALYNSFLPAQAPRFNYSVIAKDVSSQARQIADFNNDGKGDILVIEGEFKPVQFAWYEYPDWKKHDINNKLLATLSYVADCSVADVDKDGDLDIIIPDAHTNPPEGEEKTMRVLWFENPLPDRKSTEEWAMHTIADLGTVSCLKDVEVADFNLDGRIDAAVRGQKELYICTQKRSLEWEYISIPIKKNEGMASGDINRDGYVDIILNGYWLKNPAGEVKETWEEITFDPKWYDQKTGSWMDNNVQVRVEDVNKDGLLDIIISHSEKPGYPVSWYKAPKDPVNGTWLEQKIGQLDYCHTLQPGDFDNDGDIDLLAAEMKKEESKGRMVLYLNENSPRRPESWKEEIKWKELEISNKGAYWAVAGDLGGDGDLDILSSRRYDVPPVEIWENQVSDKKLSLDKWKYIEVDNNKTSWGDFDSPKWLKSFGVSAADITNDGYAEIISFRYCYLNPAGDMSGKWERFDFGINVDAMLVTDVDGDEDADIIAQSLPNIYWIEAQNGDLNSFRIIQVAKILPTGHRNSQGYQLAQIFPGGKAEILFEGGDGVYCIEIPACPEAGNWPAIKITEEGTHAEGIGAGDIDDDGYIDIATGKGWKGVVWWKNPGTRSGNWKQYEVGLINYKYVDKVAIADVNGDGRKDIIVAEELYPDEKPAHVYWFEQPFNSKEQSALFNWERRDITGEKYTLNSMSICDMDKDGDTDIITVEHKGTENTFIYENDGKGNFIEHIAYEGKEGHGGAFLYDLDGDNDFDIVNITWINYKFLHLLRNDAIK